MAIFQVQEENGQKQLVPMTGGGPVDVVESGNDLSVTSNAVAEVVSVNKIVEEGNTLVGGGKYNLFVCGHIVQLDIWGVTLSQGQGVNLVNIPQQYRPVHKFVTWGLKGGNSIDNTQSLCYQIADVVYVFTYVAMVGSNFPQLHAVWFI